MTQNSEVLLAGDREPDSVEVNAKQDGEGIGCFGWKHFEAEPLPSSDAIAQVVTSQQDPMDCVSMRIFEFQSHSPIRKRFIRQFGLQWSYRNLALMYIRMYDF
ncbi:hypothetical protein CEXT_147271 [Caerostris extrusa]|uniref:Uncharacterized protein n=1 Tax=Caerostris extrusa TaxID=172846 RepID=A0AAV4SXQ8_CAEEX|nr:hypothetical protein CEXT_147271 [Caerostris extrusa]